MLKNLKSLRRNKGISQQMLADAIGVSQQSINKYENHGVEPDIATLILMSKYFETSVDYIIGNSEINRIVEPTEAFDLNQEEALLIDSYRMLTKAERESIALVIRNYLKNKK